MRVVLSCVTCQALYKAEEAEAKEMREKWMTFSSHKKQKKASGDAPTGPTPI